MSELKYRPEIDGLRAIAVAAVVLYHADANLLPGGFVGVDIFFVISGYLITLLLAAEWRRTGRIDFPAFYARRMRRLLPALVVVVLAVMLACVLRLGGDEALVEQTAESAMASLLMVANLYFQANSGGYFDNPATAMPLLHLWSLSVEEQYYLVYPALLVLLLRYAPHGVGRRLLLLALASLLLAEYWVHILPERAFYQMPARFWELALGAVIALQSVPARIRLWDRAWLPFGLLLVAFACVYTLAWGSFPGLGAMPAVVGAGIVLLGIHRGAVVGNAAALLRARPIVALGLVSYSLYLWHWPLLVIDAGARFEPTSTLWRLWLCAVAVLMAWINWRWVERPFRHRSVSTSKTLLRGAAATGLAIVTTLVLAGVDRLPGDARRVANLARGDQPTHLTHCHFDSQQTPLVLKGPECWSRPRQTPTMMLWGDSHALAWQPFVWRVAESTDVSATAFTMYSCQPTGDAPSSTPTRSIDQNCAAMNALAMHALASGEIDTLVLGLRWPQATPADGLPQEALRVSIRGIESIVEKLPVTKRVVVIGPLPALRRSAPTCIAMSWQHQCSVPRREFELASALAWRELEALAVRYSAVILVDPIEFFCDAVVCPVSRDGYSLYWDTNHISATASRAFADRYLAQPESFRRPATRSAQ